MNEELPFVLRPLLVFGLGYLSAPCVWVVWFVANRKDFGKTLLDIPVGTWTSYIDLAPYSDTLCYLNLGDTTYGRKKDALELSMSPQD